MAKDTAGELSPFRILSLSGGGCLGYYTACVLQALERRARAPLISRFDLLAGTSIGGILALTLAAGMSADRAEENFRLHGVNVFSRRPKPAGWTDGIKGILRSLFSPKYSAEKLRSNLVTYLGDRTLGDLEVPVMITAIAIEDGSARLFSSFNREDRALKAIDVAMATSAVPAFYPLARVGGGLYIDGGLYANAPDLQVVSECRYGVGVPEERIEVLSIGTTSTHFAFPKLRRLDMGALEWLMEERMVRLTISAQQSSTDTMMRRMMGSRYLRIEARESREEQDMLGLDVATPEALSILARLADESLHSVESSRLLRSSLAGEPAG